MTPQAQPTSSSIFPASSNMRFSPERRVEVYERIPCLLLVAAGESRISDELEGRGRREGSRGKGSELLVLGVGTAEEYFHASPASTE